MSKCMVFEDGKLIKRCNSNVLWDGMWSKMSVNGPIINMIQSCMPNNCILIIPQSDGNLYRTTEPLSCGIMWYNDIQPYIDEAKTKNKIFILGTLSQVIVEPDINYFYIPLDDDFFMYGTQPYFNIIPWNSKLDSLIWRGGCSGVGGNQSLRVRFVEKLYGYPGAENVKLSYWWSENKNINPLFFADRIPYTDMLKHKIFFIVDGNVIASNHMWGFACNAVPFLISNGICWFSNLLIPYIHYIPINYNLDNLIEQIEWVKNNDTKAEQIASNAYQFSVTYFSSIYQHSYIKNELSKYI